MKQVFDVNIENQYPIPTPNDIHSELPLPSVLGEKIYRRRREVEAVISRKDPRILVITGPCSIDDRDTAGEYASRLVELRKKVADKMLLVMRTYFEKPRTTLGWKGFVYDPDLDNSYNMEKGLRESRKLLLELAELGLPAATEFLDPIIPQYIADLISWAAIGARTVESQTHRQLASGLSMPVGFKNATDGSILVAIDAILTARSKHSFLGVINDGRTGVFSTKGNKSCHVVLRGGAQTPNYGSENVAYAVELMRKLSITPSVVIDCSHGNSKREPMMQPSVFSDVISQINAGQKAISGVMLESYLETGKQAFEFRGGRTRGLSVTDACLGWDETEKAVLSAWKKLKLSK